MTTSDYNSPTESQGKEWPRICSLIAGQRNIARLYGGVTGPRLRAEKEILNFKFPSLLRKFRLAMERKLAKFYVPCRFVTTFFDRRITCRAARMGVELPHEWWVRPSKSESEHVTRSYLVSDRPSESTKNQNRYNKVVFFQPKYVSGPLSVPHSVLRLPLEHGGFPPLREASVLVHGRDVLILTVGQLAVTTELVVYDETSFVGKVR